MKIYRNNTEIANVHVKESSYVYEEINGAYLAYIEFDVKNPVGLEIDDYIDYFGNKYSIRFQESISKVETSLGYEYKVTLYHDIYRLYDTAFFQYEEPDFDKNRQMYYGTASDVLGLVIREMNKNGSGWAQGSCITTKTELFDFKDKLCGDVMEDITSTFDCEFWVEGRTVNVGKREYNSNGLVLMQGAGGGFRNLTLMAEDENPPITRLYAYGGDRNIYPLEYGHDYLMLPNGDKYIEKNVDKFGRRDAVKQFDYVYPKKEFVVTTKMDAFTLRSTDIDFNLTDYLLDGIDAIVTFQTGSLAGYDLRINEESWNNTTKELVLLKNEDELDMDVPSELISFAVGDVFILTGIKMPQAYIDEAEDLLLEEAQKWLDEKCEKRVQLRAECDEIEFAERNIFITCGQMVGVYDQKLDINREIRTIAVKRFISTASADEDEESITPYRYEITLSDFLQASGLKKLIDDIKDIPRLIDDKLNPLKQYTRRTWYDVMETKEMMFDPEGSFFTDIINPLVVHTAQLIVGTNSQQMDFVGVYFIPNADGNPNLFKNTAGILEHFTIKGDGSIREWTISAGTFTLNNNQPHYVYAKCEKDGDFGEIFVTPDKIKLEDVAGYYHFWVGVLNSPRDGVRSWQPNFVYTEIAGQHITTGIIKDRNANLVINLNEGTITGYGRITDRPDLSGFATYSQLSILGDQISAQTYRIDQLGNTIATAGWLVTADAVNMFASKTLENGTELVSRINLTPNGVTINGSKISLQANQVTFSMLDQSTRNNIDGKANASSLGQLAYKSSVEQAMKDETIISGGFIRTSLIDVQNLVVGNVLKVGTWTASGHYLISSIEYADGFNFNTEVSAFGINTLASNGDKAIMMFGKLSLIKGQLPSSGTGDNSLTIKYFPGGTEERTVSIGFYRGLQGDAGYYARTLFAISHMPFIGHINSLAPILNSTGNGNYAVMWNARTGIFYIQ